MSACASVRAHTSIAICSDARAHAKKSFLQLADAKTQWYAALVTGVVEHLCAHVRSAGAHMAQPPAFHRVFGLRCVPTAPTWRWRVPSCG